MYEVRNLSDEDLGVRVFMDFVMSAQVSRIEATNLAGNEHG